jgi:hypothetical protein
VDKFVAISYITEIQYFPKIPHTPGSQRGNFSRLSGLHTGLKFYALPISGNTTNGLHKQPAEITKMFHIQQLKNYVFHVFVGKFTYIPQIHVFFSWIDLTTKSVDAV